jgi:2-hydroxychromene-2-carboxylate isomerase
MGEVVDLAARRARRERRRPPARDHRRSEQAEFLFDLADPFTYLVAERVHRELPSARWRPASAAALLRAAPGELAGERVRRAAELRARALRLPLQWPDRFPGDVPAAMRAAAHACERGRGPEFVLAASRLAFCGGFDLDDPETLAEAAAAAGLGLDEVIAAAGRRDRDAPIEAAARDLLAAGADGLPVLRQGALLACGEARITAVIGAGPLRPAAL